MTNASGLVEGHEEEAVAQLHPVLHWKLLPNGYRLSAQLLVHLSQPSIVDSFVVSSVLVYRELIGAKQRQFDPAEILFLRLA
jgi:hypothetical protein